MIPEGHHLLILEGHDKKAGYCTHRKVATLFRITGKGGWI